MADPVKQIVEIEARLAGFEQAAAAVKKLEKDLRNYIKANKGIINSEKDVKAAAKQMATAYKKRSDLVDKETKRQQKAFKKQNSSFKKQMGTLKRLTATIGSVVVGWQGLSGTIKSSLQTLDKYNKSLLVVTASAAKYDIGLAELEHSINEVSRATALTRMETMQLFEQYEKTFRIISKTGFENLTKQISEVVGPNVEKQQELANALSRFINLAPGAQSAIENLTDANKGQLASQVDLLQLYGELDIAQARAIKNYLFGADQRTEADQAARDAIKDQVEAMQNFKKNLETVGLAIAKAVMPAVKELASWLKANEKTITEWGDTLKTVTEEILPMIKGASDAMIKMQIGATDVLLSIQEELGMVEKGTTESFRKQVRLEERRRKEREKFLKQQEKMGEKEAKQSKAAANNTQGEIATLLDLSKASEKAKQAEVGRYQAIIDHQIAAGKVNDQVVLSSYIKSAEAIKDRISLLKQEIAQERERANAGLGEVARRKSIAFISSKQAEINSLMRERNELTAKVGSQYRGLIEFAQAEVTLAETRVQLLDNFAIGVGASAEARMRAFEFTQQEIEVRKQELSILKEQAKTEGPRSLAARKVLQLEAEILQKQQKQANMVKALRDGWISAIGAMNTGAGRFSKIMVTAQKNLTSGLSRFSMVVSNISGSNIGGFGTSERFSARAPGIIEGAKFGTPFETYADRRAPFGAEKLLRGNIMNVGNELQRQAGRAASGAAGGITAVTNPNLRGAMLQRPGTTVGGRTPIGVVSGRTSGISSVDVPVQNINVHFKNFEAKKFGLIIEDIAEKAVQEAISQISVGGNKPGTIEGSRTGVRVK